VVVVGAPAEAAPAYVITSVDNALQIILMLGDRPVRVSQVAQDLGVARSTAHRLLAMLVFRGFAERDNDRLYHPGPVLARTANKTGRDLAAIARPRLRALSGRFDETVHLMVLQGPDVLFVESIEGSQALKIGSRVGMVLPAHRTSGGKAILAALSSRQLAELYADVAQDRRPDLVDLGPTLRTARITGYAVNLGTTERGIHAIGAVLHGADGSPAGAISLSMPSLRLPRRRVPELAVEVRATAAAIDADLALG
jgi:DNA-binding IclR family transcriptional regulator